MGLYRRPEADQVGPGVREGHVGPGAADEGVEDSALVHVLQVAQVLAQVLLGWITLQTGAGGSGFRVGGWGGGGEGVALPSPSRTP